MTQKNAITLSAEDDRIVTNNQFGAPLAIYRQKQCCIRVSQWISVAFFLISLAALIFHLSFISHNLLALDTLSSVLPLLLVLAAVCYSWFIDIPQVRYSRLIACEEGLLHIQWKRKRTIVQALRWRNIRAITQVGLLEWIFCPPYSLSYVQAGVTKNLTLHYDCAGLEELMQHIKQEGDE
jgi:hypothetical protein